MDHISWNPAWGDTPAIADPWICLAAAATTTATVRLGTLITPLARRRPQKVAREIVSLDHLCGGRALLGVGLGEPFEFEAFGQPVRRRGRHLDEALTVLTGLLSGQALDFAGEHLSVHSPPALPGPVNGTIPIWVAGWWPKEAPFLRAARYDGVVPGKVGAERGEVLTIRAAHRSRLLPRRLRVGVRLPWDTADVAATSIKGCWHTLGHGGALLLESKASKVAAECALQRVVRRPSGSRLRGVLDF